MPYILFNLGLGDCGIRKVKDSAFLSNFYNGWARSQIRAKLSHPYHIIGLMVGFAIALGTPVNAQSTISPTLPPIQPSSETDKIFHRLLGEWQSKDPQTNELLTLIFAPNNQLFLILPTDDGASIVIKASYQIRTATKPMELDMALTPQDIALTIFEFTPEGKLRLELNGVTSGKPRPQEFSNTTAIFDNISTTTTIPDNLEVIELQSANSQADRAIPIQYITILNQAQQGYYQKNGKFATNIEELGIGTNLETESYRYQIVPIRDRSDRVMITAQPKTDGLQSYIGAVFAIDNRKTLTGICESEAPVTSSFPLPSLPLNPTPPIQCPAGFQILP